MVSTFQRLNFYYKNIHELKWIFKIFIVSSSKVLSLSTAEWQCVGAYLWVASLGTREGTGSQCHSETSDAAKISTQKECAAVRRGGYDQALSTSFVKEQRAGRARDLPLHPDPRQGSDHVHTRPWVSLIITQQAFSGLTHKRHSRIWAFHTASHLPAKGNENKNKIKTAALGVFSKKLNKLGACSWVLLFLFVFLRNKL